MRCELRYIHTHNRNTPAYSNAHTHFVVGKYRATNITRNTSHSHIDVMQLGEEAWCVQQKVRLNSRTRRQVARILLRAEPVPSALSTTSYPRGLTTYTHGAVHDCTFAEREHRSRKAFQKHYGADDHPWSDHVWQTDNGRQVLTLRHAIDAVASRIYAALGCMWQQRVESLNKGK